MAGTGKRVDLRKFGLHAGTALTILGVLSYLAHRPRASAVLVAASFLLLLFGLVLPAALAPVQRGLLRVGHALGWVNTRVLLGVIYYLFVTPIGFIMRSTGKIAIRRSVREDGPGRWKRCDRSPDPVQGLEKQY
jgi:hypothetical protein